MGDIEKSTLRKNPKHALPKKLNGISKKCDFRKEWFVFMPLYFI